MSKLLNEAVALEYLSNETVTEVNEWNISTKYLSWLMFKKIVKISYVLLLKGGLYIDDFINNCNELIEHSIT